MGGMSGASEILGSQRPKKIIGGASRSPPAIKGSCRGARSARAVDDGSHHVGELHTWAFVGRASFELWMYGHRCGIAGQLTTDTNEHSIVGFLEIFPWWFFFFED